MRGQCHGRSTRSPELPVRSTATTAAMIRIAVTSAAIFDWSPARFATPISIERSFHACRSGERRPRNFGAPLRGRFDRSATSGRWGAHCPPVRFDRRLERAANTSGQSAVSVPAARLAIERAILSFTAQPGWAVEALRIAPSTIRRTRRCDTVALLYSVAITVPAYVCRFMFLAPHRGSPINPHNLANASRHSRNLRP